MWPSADSQADDAAAEELHIFLSIVLKDRSKAYCSQVESKLLKVGVRNLRRIIPPLFTKSSRHKLNSRMKTAGEKSFTSDTLCSLRVGVLNEWVALRGFISWAAPQWKDAQLDNVLDKLDRVGIRSVKTLHSALFSSYSPGINERLRSLGLKQFTSTSLDELRRRAEQVRSFECFELRAHLISGQLLAVLPVYHDMRGIDILHGLNRHITNGCRLQSALYNGEIIRDSQFVRELGMAPGSVVQVVLGDISDDSDMEDLDMDYDCGLCEEESDG